MNNTNVLLNPYPRYGLQLHLDAYRSIDPATGRRYGEGERANWCDLSGQGNHATNTTAASRPLLQYGNGRPQLFYNGIDSVLNVANLTQKKICESGAMTLLLVATNTTTAAQAVVGGKGDSTPYFFLAKSSTWYWGMNNQQLTYGAGPGISVTTPQCVIWEWDQSGLSATRLTTNGGNAYAIPYTGGPVTSLNSLSIGACSVGSRYWWGGNMHELMLYNRALSTNDKARLTRYLCAKWGIPYQGV